MVLAQRALHLEMIAPASEFHSLIAPLTCFLCQFFQRQIRPLAAEEDDGPRHTFLPCMEVVREQPLITSGLRVASRRRVAVARWRRGGFILEWRAQSQRLAHR